MFRQKLKLTNFEVASNCSAVQDFGVGLVNSFKYLVTKRHQRFLHLDEFEDIDHIWSGPLKTEDESVEGRGLDLEGVVEGGGRALEVASHRAEHLEEEGFPENMKNKSLNEMEKK